MAIINDAKIHTLTPIYLRSYFSEPIPGSGTSAPTTHSPCHPSPLSLTIICFHKFHLFLSTLCLRIFPNSFGGLLHCEQNKGERKANTWINCKPFFAPLLYLNACLPKDPACAAWRAGPQVPGVEGRVQTGRQTPGFLFPELTLLSQHAQCFPGPVT